MPNRIRNISRRNRRRIALSAVPAIALVLTAACGSSSGGQGGKDVYVIGDITAVQGNQAEVGKSFLRGAELAVAQINHDQTLGKGKTIKLATAESENTPALSISAANKLLGRSDLVALLCCTSSPTTQPVLPIATAKKMPVAIFGATLPGLAKPPYVFRSTLVPNPGIQSLASTFGAAHPGLKSVAYVVAADSPANLGQVAAFRKGIPSSVKDLGVTNTQMADTDFNGAASAVLSKAPDAVFVSSVINPEAGIIKALRDRGYRGEIVANGTIAPISIFKATGQSLVNVPFPSEYVPTSEIPRSVAFTKAFKAKYHTEPDLYASQGYENINFAAEAIERAAADGGTVDPKSVADGMADVQSLDTVWGTVTFAEGQATLDKIQFAIHGSAGELELWKP
jgi:branched-chain amino acid transport system substrate-binding protein